MLVNTVIVKLIQSQCVNHIKGNMHLETLVKPVTTLISFMLLTIIAVFLLQTCGTAPWVIKIFSIDLIRFQSDVNNLASPINSDHIKDYCTHGTESNDTYVWPLYGEVDNCIVHFTKTY